MTAIVVSKRSFVMGDLIWYMRIWNATDTTVLSTKNYDHASAASETGTVSLRLQLDSSME